MTIKYELKFQNEGFTLTHTIDGDGATGNLKADAPVEQNVLPAIAAQKSGRQKGTEDRILGSGGLDDRIPGSGGLDDRIPGSGGLDGGGPITVIGPFIFMSPRAKTKGEESSD